MKIIDLLKKEPTEIEYYACKKVKYLKENQEYYFPENSIVSLNNLDKTKSLSNFYQIIKNYLIENFNQEEVIIYQNHVLDQEFSISVDNNIRINLEKVSAYQADINLLEDKLLSFNYLLIKVTIEKQDLLLWFKLKSPLKLENANFIIEKHNYQLAMTKEGLKINNYPTFKLDLAQLSFIYYENDCFIINKDNYQKYFNLEDYYLYHASELIYKNNHLISDGEIINKSNAKMIYNYYDNIDHFINEILSDNIKDDDISLIIDALSLNLSYNNKQFILKSNQDVIDLLLLASGCLGINKLNNESFKVKKPQYLDDIE
ncbi:MAG: hypothetical protein LBT75_00290 [Bacilli bacterium]|jgi:hypothetical protein|nr:hypothetical protein [Bacilli bacterium]